MRKPGRLLTIVLFLAAWLSSTETAFGQKSETGFLDRSVVVEKKEYRYQVFVPRDFTRSRKWPVILALHGGGEYGDDGVRQTSVGIGAAIRRNVSRFQALVVIPQAKADGKPGWQLDGGRAALAALDKTIKEFNGDPRRLILTGLSAGGNGSWFLASRYPEKFAALVVVCAFVSKFTSPSNRIEYPALAEGPDPHSEIAKKVAKIPIRIYHGDADDIVLPVESRKMAAALKAAGANYEYFELPKVNHNAWDPAYNDANLIEWILKQQKPR
jgi:predicted peptidase